MPPAVELKALQPKEAIAFFRQKGYRTTFSWQDMMHEAHAQAFTVAGVSRLDVLQDLRTAVDDAIANGSTYGDFKKVAQEKLAARGWWGPVEVTDPATGAKKMVDLSRSRRLQIIFNTNLRTSYAAGHWTRIQRTKDVLPFLRYSAVLDRRTRPLHRQWNGTVLPVDDPWWKTHFPPNGWNCRCTVVQMSQGMVDRAGLRVQPEGPMSGGDLTFKNNRTGEVIKVPQGIDPGFGYNVGETASFPDPAKYTDAALGKQAALLSVASENFADLVAGKVAGTAPVAWLDDQILKALDVQVRRVDLSSDTMAKQLTEHPDISLEEYRQLPELLENGLVIPSDDQSVEVYGVLDDPDGRKRAYRAIVKRTGDGQAMFLVSFHKALGRRIRQALRATAIRDHAELRTLQFGRYGVVDEAAGGGA